MDAGSAANKTVAQSATRTRARNIETIRFLPDMLAGAKEQNAPAARRLMPQLRPAAPCG
jgi:hypothetical protein